MPASQEARQAATCPLVGSELTSRPASPGKLRWRLRSAAALLPHTLPTMGPDTTQGAGASLLPWGLLMGTLS